MRLLLVEDERALADPLSRALADEGFAVDRSFDGEDGLHRAVEIDYDVAVLAAWRWRSRSSNPTAAPSPAPAAPAPARAS